MGHVGKTVTQNIVSGSEITDGTVTGDDLASDIAISTSGAITTTGAFTSKGIDDNASSEMLNLEQNANSTTSKMLMVGENNNINNWSYNGRSGIIIEGTSNAILALGRSSTAGQSAYIYHDGTLGITNQEATNINIGHNTGTAIAIDSNGHVTMPLQPAFNASNISVTQSNIAINTDVTVVFGTERFDNNGDFTSNVFTAPVTGRYQLNTMIRFGALDTGATYYALFIDTSNRRYLNILDPNGFSQDLDYYTIPLSVVADMDANDTAKIIIHQSAGTAQTDLDSGTGSCHFSGYLVA